MSKMVKSMTMLKKVRGVTLIELMTTVSVAAVSLTLGVPSFNNVRANLNRTQTSTELMTSFSLARSEAGRRGVSVTVCPSSDGATCSQVESPNWSSGWIVFTDQDEDSAIDTPTDELIYTARFDNAAFSLTAEPSIAGGVALRGSGFPGATGNFTYCDEWESRTLALSFIGRIDLIATGSGCP